jgi:hypothetical protein
MVVQQERNAVVLPDEAHISKSRYGAPDLCLRFEVLGVLDGADFDVGLSAGLVAAETCDPDFAVADHGPFGVDEEVFIFLLQDGVGDVVGDDAVVVLDEGSFVLDDKWMFAGVDFDGVVDKGSCLATPCWSSVRILRTLT